MCCCGKPTVNGEEGYSWDGKNFSVYKPNPPALQERDELIRDLPGRCGGVDSHSHHFRVVKQSGLHYLLVRHGGGDERIRLRNPGVDALMTLDSGPCYWALQMLYHVQEHSASRAAERTEGTWRAAAAQKRIKTRKQRGGERVKVWIEQPSTL